MKEFPARASVDLTAIRANTHALGEFAGGAEVMAIVKADGYGHGLIPSAFAAKAGGATWFGVAQLTEARQLRAASITEPIFSWLYAPGTDFAAAIKDNIDLSVSAPWALAKIADAATSCGTTARIHLKIDTGMGRGGSTAGDWSDLVRAAALAQAEGSVEVVGVWSHLATADEPGEAAATVQINDFMAAVAIAESEGLRPSVRHLANSAATIALPQARFDLVRPGIALYGLSPFPHHADSVALGLRPAMTLTAKLILVKDVPAGQTVSYGGGYVTERATRLGLVPLGYSDGIPRNASGTGPVLAGGARTTVAGRVCMDQFVIDLGPPDNDGAASLFAAGDEIVVFGPGDNGEPTAQEWADAVGSISYEIVSRVGARVPREYGRTQA